MSVRRWSPSSAHSRGPARRARLCYHVAVFEPCPYRPTNLFGRLHAVLTGGLLVRIQPEEPTRLAVQPLTSGEFCSGGSRRVARSADPLEKSDFVAFA